MYFCKKLILLFIVISTNGFAYEPATHQELSEWAVDRSSLGDTNKQILIDLGLIDNVGDDSPEFQTSTGIQNQSIVDLIRFGAEFEDDVETKRSLNHFYDPQNNRPLFGFGQVRGVSSPDWSLEDVVDIIGEQVFSYRHANEYLYNSLTALSKQERDRNWGLTFQSLGQVIHHIQDMAQPQHVRNDAHCDLIFPCGLDFLIGEDFYAPSMYEKYTGESHQKLASILATENYPDIDLTVFNSTRDFWDNAGKGLAEFTSTNFVSAGTNFQGGLDSNSNLVFDNDPEYPLPSGADANSVDSSIDIEGEECNNQNECVPTIINGSVTFIETPVYDANLNQNSINERASTFSIFDYDLIGQSLPPKFALNSLNYDAAHEYLIPRAVAYSAGLIDYFFRGRIEANVTADGDGIEITNVSKGNFAFQAGGAFEVYYVTDADEHKPILSLSYFALGSSLPVDGVHTITGLNAALQGITDLGSEGKIIVLFDGDIGSERGVAVGLVKTAFISINGSDSIIENEIRVSENTITITLTGGLTWVAEGIEFDAVRQDIIDGITSEQNEPTGWNNEVRDNLGVGDVRRISDTVVTITWSAQPNYEITEQETITLFVPVTSTKSTDIYAIMTSPTKLTVQKSQVSVDLINSARDVWGSSIYFNFDPNPYPNLPLNWYFKSMNGVIDIPGLGIIIDCSTGDLIQFQEYYIKYIPSSASPTWAVRFYKGMANTAARALVVTRHGVAGDWWDTQGAVQWVTTATYTE